MSKTKAFYAPIAILIAAGALAACATDPASGSAASSSDAKITQNIEAQIDKRPDLAPPEEIEVQTKNHVVYLSGLVDSGVAGENAELVARQTNGVTDVINMIAVEE